MRGSEVTHRVGEDGMGEGGMAGCGFSAFSLDSKDPTQPYRLNHPFTQQPQNRPLVSSSIRTFFQKQSLIHSNLDFLAAEFWVVGGTTWLLDILRFTYKFPHGFQNAFSILILSALLLIKFVELSQVESISLWQIELLFLCPFVCSLNSNSQSH
ncbi:hypothetical protein DVH24_026720 [Malus domestica]|uniref:Uncharacterized protein n=1 Tax=Malus domestica TaxID=3750 RepID=A0A498K1Z4_MALDO|nr:hypothetical protein DVH24_026720 [Malus domestica]